MNSYLNSGVILVYKVILNELDGQSAFPYTTSPDNYQLVFCHSGWKREKVNGEKVKTEKCNLIGFNQEQLGKNTTFADTSFSL